VRPGFTVYGPCHVGLFTLVFIHGFTIKELLMAAIELRSIQNKVLNDINLAIEDGEIFVLLGPSGAGKTSLLNVLAGLMPYSGQVFFNGTLMNETSPQKRRVGYVFQDLMLFPHLTVRDNLNLAMRNLGIERRQKAIRANGLLDLLKISHLEKRRPDLLSGGEKQRVALARCLATRPKILLLDEPFNNLDFRSARYLRQELINLQRDLGLTTLFVTHNLDEAKTMAHRMAVMSDGCLTEIGKPKDMLNGCTSSEPSFLERANILSPSAMRDVGNGLKEMAWAGMRLFVPDEGRGCAKLAVLPSRIKLGRNPPPGPEVNRFEAIIDQVHEIESSVMVHLNVEKENIVAELAAEAWRDISLQPGERVHAVIKMSDLKAY
jgi:ABC-type sugar transport system ATPase subunit